MLTSIRKPGPPVPPRPSAAAVANALAKHRENSPSHQQQQQHISGVHTLKPPHPGRTVVYKSPAFDQQVIKKPQSCDPKEPLGGSKTEVYVGKSHGGYNNNVPRPVLPPPPPVTTISTNNSSSLENGKLMYTSTCSIIEINSSSSASTSASSSPVSTLQKTTDSKATNLLGIGGGHRNHFNSADEEDDTSICQKLLKNTYNHRHHHQLLDPLDGNSSDGDLIAIKRNSPDVIVISSSLEHDSGTEHNSMDTNSIASSNSLERENNLKNREPSRTSHLTEIIIGSDGSDLVTNGTSTTSTIIEATNHVIRSSSIRLPYRPEPEGGEHVTPSNDANSVIKVTPPSIDPSTLDSKLSEKKVAFHELLISELTAMRSPAAAAIGAQSDSITRRQRKPPENRSSPEISPTGTARIRTADWIEVGDNGKEVVLSSCQISLEDSGLEDEGKHDEDGDDDGGSSGVGDSWDSVKDAEERITMSLPGLPPLPKSLSGFDLAGQQLQSHQQHHHQNHHHHQQHHPPQHQPPAPVQQHQQQHIQQHLQPPQQHSQQQQQPQPQQPPSLNHHPTNPFIPIGVNLQSVSMASLVSQRGQSPVSSTVSSSSMAATPNSGSGSGGGGGVSSSQQSGSVRKPTTLDTQLAILRREMYGLRQLDLSLLSQLWALNESIQEFRTMLQEQETLSPPSPTPSNSDANSVSSDDDEDDSSNTQTVGAGIGAGPVSAVLTNHHNLIESVAAASVLSSAAQTASSRMRAPPPPPPNRKAPSRPV